MPNPSELERQAHDLRTIAVIGAELRQAKKEMNETWNTYSKLNDQVNSLQSELEEASLNG